MERGRPVKLVNEDLLRYLRGLNFTWEAISYILGVSSKTIQRRAKTWNITSFDSLTDSDLDRIVLTILSQFPQSGEVMVCGHLRAMKVRRN